MDKPSALEFSYARRLRECGRQERRELYAEAYAKTSAAALAQLPEHPEARTAGTSPGLVRALKQLCRADDTVLEVGCGRGYTCLKLAPYVSQVIGADVSAPALRETEDLLRKHGITNARTVNVNAFELDREFGEFSFDKVVSIDLIEHLHPDDAMAHLKGAFDVLKPDGAMLVVSPNRLTGPHDITRRHFPAAKEALDFHLNEVSQKELITRLRSIGFQRFESFVSHDISWLPFSGARYPVAPALWSEAIFEHAIRQNRNLLRLARKFSPLLRIRMIAHKAKK